MKKNTIISNINILNSMNIIDNFSNDIENKIEIEI